jgi:hypothetical protein
MNLIEPQPPAAGRLRRRAGAVPTAGAISLIGISSPTPRIALRRGAGAGSGHDARFGSTAPRGPMVGPAKKWAPRPEGPDRDAAGARLERVQKPWPPLTALGEGSVGRSIGERTVDALLARARLLRGAAWRAREVRSPAYAHVADAVDGTPEIRRCFPIPSPPHSPPPPLRRPGESEGQSFSLNNFLR